MYRDYIDDDELFEGDYYDGYNDYYECDYDEEYFEDDYDLVTNTEEDSLLVLCCYCDQHFKVSLIEIDWGELPAECPYCLELQYVDPVSDTDDELF